MAAFLLQLPATCVAVYPSFMYIEEMLALLALPSNCVFAPRDLSLFDTQPFN